MRAVVARRLEGPASVEVIDTAVPEPGPGQVRLRVAAAAVNPVDVITSSGLLVELGLTGAREQFGIGWDVAGIVDALGPGVDGVIGSAVIGLIPLLGRPLKSHAEYVVADASAIAPAPAGLDLVAAATIPLNALTAWQALDALRLGKGDSVLVTGAAGGVGGYAVELAKDRGLTVVATASDQDEELVRGLGADHFVPRSADLSTTVRELVPGGVDGLVDAAVIGVGAQEAVRDHGSHAHLLAGQLPPPLRGIKVTRVLVVADRDQLTEISRLTEQGVLSARVAATYPLDQAATAYQRLAEGGVRGRVVLVS